MAQIPLISMNSPFQQPLVSVVIPTFNRPDSLREALESVLSQTFQNYEIVVVNDGGVDVSNVIRLFASDRRTLYLQHTDNKGLAATRNTAIRAAHGKYVAYLDDDDIYYPDHLETLVCFLESSVYKVAYTDSYQALQSLMKDHYETTHKEVLYSCDFDREKLLIHNYIPVLNLVYRKDLLEDVGLFDETLETHEDWELLIRLSQKCDFSHIKSVTAEFRIRDDKTNMTEMKRSVHLRTLRQIHQRYSHLALDVGVLEAQKNIEKALEIDVAIRQLPTRELFKRVEQYIRQKNDTIGNLEAIIQQKNDTVGNLETIIQQKNDTVGNLEAIIQQKYDTIGNLEMIIVDKDVQIDNLSIQTKYLEAENSQLVKEKLQLEQNKQQLCLANLKIAQHENHLNLMYTSLSWRLTWPLRWLGSLVLKTIMRPSIELSPKRISKVTDNRSYSLPVKSGVDIDKEAIGKVIHAITDKLKAKMPE